MRSLPWFPTFALACGLTAQERWQLGNDAAHEFRRTQTVRSTVLATKEVPPPPADADLGVLRGVAIAPLLVPSDLDRDQRTLLVPPNDLRDLARFVAFDLKRAPRSKSRATIPQVAPFGDLLLTIATDALQADGTQRIVCEIAGAPPDPRGEVPASFAAWTSNVFDHGLEARLEITRELDKALGVRGFRAKLEAKIEYPPSHARRAAALTIEETWQYQKTWRAESPELRQRIVETIRRGSRFLQERLAKPDAGELAHAIEREGTVTYNSGRLALGVLAVLKAEADPNLATLQPALAELRRREFRDTYSLACAIMALEALYAPASEREDLLTGRIARPYPRKPSGDDRALLEQLVARLLENRDPRFDRATRLAWGYGSGHRHDASNSQYALLGLWSASLCGVEVPPAVWAAAANHWLLEQRTTKDVPVELRTVTYAQHARQAAKDPTRGSTSTLRRVEPFGWPYVAADGRPAYGSMTCAGITALSLCAAALAQGKNRGEHQVLLQKTERAIAQGFAWLSQRFTERYNPGFPPAPQQWHHYYLYSLERACELSQVVLLNERDWYFEGAVQLCVGQHESGEFLGSGFEGTCFGVLFLKKATLPALTPRR